MDFVDHLFNSSLSELSTLEASVGVVLLGVLGLSVAFVAYKLLTRSLQECINNNIEDFYNDSSRWDD